MADIDVVKEAVELGAAGTFSFNQYSSVSFNQLCLSSNSEAGDATGLRVYSGAHVLTRFLSSTQGLPLLDGKRVVELGCGTGVVGCVVAVNANLSQLVLTDGDERSCALAQRNAECIVHPVKGALKVTTQQLLWGGSPLESTFDVVIGCELMYYQTNVAALIQTVQALAPCGLFLHAHLFRQDEHGDTMREIFDQTGWDTALVPVPSFIPPAEMSLWPQWLNVCCLVSGPRAQIELLLALNPSWSRFQDVDATLDENLRVAEEMEDN
ncbi:unnamed protein product [Aphanomyces euteiches]|uniref:Methyltransferase small domain-containing protein n=1 Tax=Aphanomyces euteiches TaxID=100861 RepID=A0A6G0XRV1_9STRA|nr:hypothetical protein Ae201684_002138 [Aphanomyces euteiches]KAH9132425.1 hypothetical protein AeRB84_021183 [Aphanomyces euteiches]